LILKKKKNVNNFREQAPISSRLNAVDLYLVVCVFFVFSALMEYAAILMLLKKRRKPKRTIDEGLKTIFPIATRNGDVNQPVQRPERKKNNGGAVARAVPDTVTPHKQALCDNIDAWALWISPPVFLFFNLVYWVAYRHVNEFEFDNT
jgi:hypothetical protein